jgi:carboxylesterase
LLSSRTRTVADQAMLGRGDAEFFSDGRAPAVVAFHGFGGTAAELRPLLDRIARGGYAVDAALLPGHGTRVERLQDLTFDDWLGASRARVRQAAARHGRVVVLGFSLGSLLAMELAAEGGGGVAALVVMGNALTLAAHTSVPLGLADRLGLRMPDAYLVKPRAGDLVDPAAMGDLVSYDRHPLRSALEVYRAGRRVRRLVGSIACPTLILHGRRDLVCPWANATWLSDRIGSRDVSLRIFERSAHVLACDAERDEVAREVLAFVGRFG